MKNLRLASLLLASLLLIPTAPVLAETADAFFQFNGNGYETGGFEFSDPGDELHLISEITDANAPPWLPLDLYDPDTNPDGKEYTLVVTGLISNGEIDQGGYSTVTYNLGLLQIYEDPSRNADWTEIPSIPNPPSTFFDGELWLEGDFSQFQVALFRDLGMGSYDGWVMLSGGSAIDYFATDAYYFGGALIPPHAPEIPEGYDLHIEGELWTSAVATETSSISQIKALY